MRKSKKGAYSKAVESARKDVITRTLKTCNGDVVKCAGVLGVSYATVRSRAKMYGYPLEDMRHYNTGRR